MFLSGKSDYFRGDRYIWYIYALLSVFSILVVYSAVSSLAFRYTGGNTESYLFKQIGVVLFSAVVAFLIHRIHFRKYASIMKILLWLMPALILYTYFKGQRFNGASRWIPIFGWTIQTFDVVRIVVISNLAIMLSKKQHFEEREHNYKNIVFWCGLICVLLLGLGFSTSVLLAATCLLVMWAGRVPTHYLLRLGAAVALGICSYVGASIIDRRLSEKEHLPRAEAIVDRIEAYTTIELDGKNGVGGVIGKESKQKDNALIAIASGGFFGVGPGNSFQKYRLSEAYSDYIYTIIIEEYGLLGGLFVMALYIALLYRGIFNIDFTQKPLEGLLCIGLTISIVFQALAHIIINVGLGPVTGQTLPIISQGGSSVLFTSIAIGMILSVTRQENLPSTLKFKRR